MRTPIHPSIGPGCQKGYSKNSIFACTHSAAGGRIEIEKLSPRYTTTNRIYHFSCLRSKSERNWESVSSDIIATSNRTSPVSGLGSRVSGLGSRVSGLGSRWVTVRRPKDIRYATDIDTIPSRFIPTFVKLFVLEGLRVM